MLFLSSLPSWVLPQGLGTCRSLCLERSSSGSLHFRFHSVVSESNKCPLLGEASLTPCCEYSDLPFSCCQGRQLSALSCWASLGTASAAEHPSPKAMLPSSGSPTANDWLMGGYPGQGPSAQLWTSQLPSALWADRGLLTLQPNFSLCPQLLPSPPHPPVGVDAKALPINFLPSESASWGHGLPTPPPPAI